MSYIPIINFLLIFLLLSCEKDDDFINEQPQMIVGDYVINEFSIYKNNNIRIDLLGVDSAFVDLNNDGAYDVEFIIHASASAGGINAGNYQVIPLGHNVKMMSLFRIDTICKYNDSYGWEYWEVYNPNKNYPSNLSIGIWKRYFAQCFQYGEKVYFDSLSNSKAYLRQYDLTHVYGYIGSINFQSIPKGPFYLAFQIISDNKAHYAWLKINTNYSYFYIQESFYR